jgi:hypothetical protein
LGAGLAARLGAIPISVLLANGAMAFGAGLVLGAVLGRAGARGGRAAPSMDATAAHPNLFYSAKTSTCPECRRPLLPGVTTCPFCHPAAAPVEGEGTINREHNPLLDPVAMPGLAATAKLKREAGAKGYLHVFGGPGKGQSILLATTVVSIGRAPGNTLVLDDGGVSQKHAEVRPTATDRFILKDLKSKNGTFLNDRRIDEATLNTGDVISFGDVKIYVQVG